MQDALEQVDRRMQVAFKDTLPNMRVEADKTAHSIGLTKTESLSVCHIMESPPVMVKVAESPLHNGILPDMFQEMTGLSTNLFTFTKAVSEQPFLVFIIGIDLDTLLLLQ
jgi:hypothetical protein